MEIGEIMKLRRLEQKDSKKMLEWMTDNDLSKHLRIGQKSIDMESVIQFINLSQENTANLHLAISFDSGEYIGTISLKSISFINSNSEYAVALTRDSIGKGIAKVATDTILYIGFQLLDLNKIYLNVASNNKRAISFYNKYGFTHEGTFKEHIFLNNEFTDLEWYGITKKQFNTITNLISENDLSQNIDSSVYSKIDQLKSLYK